MQYILIAIGVIVLILLVTNIHVVQQSRAFVVERLGAYHTTWGVGPHVKLPILDRVAKRVSLKEQVVDFAPQPVITKDNVTMQIDTVIYFQITDPKLYTYGVEHPMSAIENLTATTLRNIIGDLELDQSLTSRDHINTQMRAILDEATDPLGIKVNHPPGRRRQAGRHPGGRGTGRRHPEGAAGHGRLHQAPQRRQPQRPGGEDQGPGGLPGRRRRQGHQDHHPQRDPGSCRPRLQRQSAAGGG